MVLMPKFKDEIIPFAKLAVDLGVDYGVIKHCSDDEFGTLGVDYSKYEEMYDLLEKAESLTNETTKIIVKWDKIKDKGKPSYKRFYGPQFLLQISGSGLIAPSGMFFNARYSKLHMGNFADERFKDVWVRELPSEAITYHPLFKPYEDNIPKFMQRMYPMSMGSVCILTGVRAQESLRRYTIVMNKRHRNYITVSPDDKNVWTAHPIYDWQSTDVWHYMSLKRLDYNHFYDVLNRTKLSGNFLQQRLCAPLGEEPLRGLWMYKHIDPELYNAMLKRVPGVATAARYANTELYAIALKEPPKGQTWESYLKLIIASYEVNAGNDVATRINKMIFRHFKQSILGLTEQTPDPVSGCSWKFLCQVALRGDFKGRTQTKMTSLGKKLFARCISL